MSQARRILHFIDSSGLYGAEKVVLALSQEMKKSPVYEPVVGCIVHGTKENVALYHAAREEGIEARKILIRSRLFPWDLARLPGMLKRERISVIHSHGYKPSVFGFVLSHLTGIPVMATCHLWYKNQRRPLKYRVMTGLEMFFYRFFKQMVAVSEPIREQLVAGGVAGGKIAVIPNGICREWLSGGERPERVRLRGDRRFVILNVARLTAQKAQHRIVEAAEILKGWGRRIRFLLVGEGEARSGLETAIREKQLQEEVKLIGFHPEAAAMMASAHLFVLPSMDEGLPISMLEAMGSRLPVVATPVGEIPKLVKHGRTGLLVARDDAADLAGKIGWAMDHPAAMEKIADEAFALVSRQYTSEAMFRAYAAIYANFMRKEENR